MNDQKRIPSQKEAKSCTISLAVDGMQEVLQEAGRVKLLDILDVSDQSMNIKLSYTQYHFLNGQWLEVYVWDEANSLQNGLVGVKLFSDCQWDQRIPDENNPNDDRNQIDVALLYNAQLIIVECKTGDDFFKTDTIYKLNSVARSLGDRFVTKMLVTSIHDFTRIPAFDKKTEGLRDKLIDVKTRARNDHIVLIMREDLMNMREILKKQDATPFAQFFFRPGGRQAGTIFLTFRVPQDHCDGFQNTVNPGNKAQAPISSIQTYHARTDAIPLHNPHQQWFGKGCIMDICREKRCASCSMFLGAVPIQEASLQTPERSR